VSNWPCQSARRSSVTVALFGVSRPLSSSCRNSSRRRHRHRAVRLGRVDGPLHADVRARLPRRLGAAPQQPSQQPAALWCWPAVAHLPSIVVEARSLAVAGGCRAFHGKVLLSPLVATTCRSTSIRHSGAGFRLPRQSDTLGRASAFLSPLVATTCPSTSIRDSGAGFRPLGRASARASALGAGFRPLRLGLRTPSGGARPVGALVEHVDALRVYRCKRAVTTATPRFADGRPW
jgi:hypothetical protein